MEQTVEDLKFGNYPKEIYFDSDAKEGGDRSNLTYILKPTA